MKASTPHPASVGVLTVILFTLSFAAEAQWVATRQPYGGNVDFMSSIPDRNGINWLLAHTVASGVFWSSDAGNTWRLGGTDGPSINFPKFGRLLSLASDGPFVYAAGSGIHVSSDYGTTWRTLADSVVPFYCHGSSIVIDDSVLYTAVVNDYPDLGAPFSDILSSSDHGTTWTRLRRTAWDVNSLQMMHAGGHTYLLAGGGSGAAVVSVCRDNDSVWVDHFVPHAYVVNGLLIVPDSAGRGEGTIFVRTGSDLLRSSDMGIHWVAADSGMPGGNISSLLFSGGNMFAGVNDFEVSRSGMFRSTNSGKNWTPGNEGLVNRFVTSLLALSGAHGTGELFAATGGGGIYRSSNQGVDWAPVNKGLTAVGAGPLAAGGGCLFLGTYGAGVFRSSDTGRTWTAVNDGLMDPRITDLVSIPDRSGRFGLMAATERMGLSFSGDGGETWQEANTGLGGHRVRRLLVSSHATDTAVYAGTDQGVYYSTNAGTSWLPMSDGLGTAGVFQLVEGPAVPGGSRPELFAAVYANDSYDGGVGIFRTSDRQHWEEANIGLTTKAVSSLAAAGKNVYAGTYFGGIFKSTDNGNTWTPVNGHGLPSLYINCIAAYSHASGKISLIVGTEAPPSATHGGVYRTDDEGSDWVDVSAGMTVSDVYGLRIIGSELFAAGWGLIDLQGGTDFWQIYHRPLSELATAVTRAAGISVPGRTTLEQNYPNPFNPVTTIRYTLSQRGQVALTVFNTLGQKVAEPVNGEIDAGYHEVQFNAAHLASGVYFYRLQAGDFIETKSLLVVR